MTPVAMPSTSKDKICRVVMKIFSKDGSPPWPLGRHPEPREFKAVPLV